MYKCGNSIHLFQQTVGEKSKRCCSHICEPFKYIIYKWHQTIQTEFVVEKTTDYK